ncbi:MAG: CvpA family protein [candidate division Zixibacteria bacterium]|nr:CvpA family protein [candidate division Zixibacteria bacterium]
MNWVDAVLLALLLAMVIVGMKKGLIRELTALVIFFVAIIISINYIDHFAVWVHNQLGGSPVVSAFLSFVILLTGSYAAFKIVGLIFYKIADIKWTGKKDQMGGALVGFLRGWLLIGFVTFLAFLLPLPNSFYISFENSLFGPAIAKTVPLIYDGTSLLHPNNPDFIEKIETTLLMTQSQTEGGATSEARDEVYTALQNLHRFFNTGLGSS